MSDHHSHPEANRESLAIGVLSVTAVVLVVGIVIVQLLPAPVRADGMTATGGDYIMTVGSLTSGDEEYVYVIDTPSSKLAVYRFDSIRHEVQIIQGIELSRLRTPKGEPVPVAGEGDSGDASGQDAKSP